MFNHVSSGDWYSMLPPYLVPIFVFSCHRKNCLRLVPERGATALLVVKLDPHIYCFWFLYDNIC